MKKAITALAGILSVMLLASCQKEVEIDGDVSEEKTSYEYYLDVTECTATQVEVVYDEASKKWNKADGAVTYTLKANTASVSWNTNKNTNMTEYELRTGYEGALKADEKALPETIRFAECNGKYYRCDDNREWLSSADFVPENGLTVTGSPKEASFTIAGTWVEQKIKDWVLVEGEEWVPIYQNQQYSVTALKFTRK